MKITRLLSVLSHVSVRSRVSVRFHAGSRPWIFAFCLLLSASFAGCDQNGNNDITDDPAAAIEDSGTLVVLNKSAYTAMIIDMATREVLETLPTGVSPHEAVISPDGSIAVASNYGEYDGEPGHTLTVIDLENRVVDREIDLGEFTRPHGLEWFDDGEHLAVTGEGQQSLVILHVPTDEIVKVIPTDQERSHMVHLYAGNTRAIVPNIDSGTISIIDLEAEETVALVETGEGAEGVAISPDESEAWISNRYEDTISIVDLESYEVVATLDSGSFPIRATFTPDGGHVLVANMNGGDVSVFDAATRAEVRRIDLEPDNELNARPVGMLKIPNDRILVAGTLTDRLYVIDLRNFEIIDHIPTGEEPDGMAFTLAH